VTLKEFLERIIGSLKSIIDWSLLKGNEQGEFNLLKGHEQGEPNSLRGYGHHLSGRQTLL